MKDNLLLFVLSEPPQLCVKIPGLFPVFHQLSGFPVSQLSGHTELLLHMSSSKTTQNTGTVGH